MLRVLFASLTGLFLIMMSACGSQPSASHDADYDTTKKMVVDILQTEDGKQALADILSDKKLQQQLIMNDDAVKKAIDDVLTSKKGQKVWEKLFSDPAFVKDYAKSMADENKKLIKQLMKDPTFQKQLLELMQNPEMKKEILTVLKGQKFRAHLEKIMKETAETPMFKAKAKELLEKVVKEVSEKNNSGKKGGDKAKEGQSDSEAG